MGDCAGGQGACLCLGKGWLALLADSVVQTCLGLAWPACFAQPAMQHVCPLVEPNQLHLNSTPPAPHRPDPPCRAACGACGTPSSCWMWRQGR